MSHPSSMPERHDTATPLVSVLSARMRRVAILCAAVIALATFGTPTAASAQSGSPYFGRWTVAFENQRYSVRGREYKTFDIAPCGRSFCGVSVNDQKRCGAVLFRFPNKSRNAEWLNGRGKWGKTFGKKVHIYFNEGELDRLIFFLGDSYNMSERSPSMVTFSAGYDRLGNARCTVRA